MKLRLFVRSGGQMRWFRGVNLIGDRTYTRNDFSVSFITLARPLYWREYVGCR
jgi:hypothetical protein